MAGSLYIWIMGALFLGVCVLVVAFFLILRIGHWMEKNQTGVKHGFLELPPESQSRPAGTANLEPDDSQHFQHKEHEGPEERKETGGYTG